jgi:hypothetical protein
VFVPCAVCRALRLTAILARDTGRDLQCKGKGFILSKGLIHLFYIILFVKRLF